jgi:hypothetical protein
MRFSNRADEKFPDASDEKFANTLLRDCRERAKDPYFSDVFLMLRHSTRRRARAEKFSCARVDDDRHAHRHPTNCARAYTLR